MSTQEIAGSGDTQAPPGLGERLALTAAGLRTEMVGSFRLAADARSFARLALDGLGYRLQRVVRIGDPEARRRVRFKDGTELTYRLNRGDVRAIAEVWMSEAYRLPFALRAGNVLDLGANIGAAGVWLARRYGSSRLVAAEPVPANAALARLNFARNGIVAEVVEAAVGPPGSVAHFQLSSTSTLGRVADHGIEVPVVAIEQLLERFPAQERVELVKLDIEGAEQQLFDSRLGWLARVDCLIVELHRDRVDVDRIVGTLRDHGFSPSPIGEDNLYGGLSDVTAAFSRSS